MKHVLIMTCCRYIQIYIYAHDTIIHVMKKNNAKVTVKHKRYIKDAFSSKI